MNLGMGARGVMGNSVDSTLGPRWEEPALGRAPLHAWAGTKGEEWGL